jgi:hypothetical protein
MTLEEFVASSPPNANIEAWRSNIYMLNALIFAKGFSKIDLGSISKSLIAIGQDIAILQRLVDRRSERKKLEASLRER